MQEEEGVTSKTEKQKGSNLCQNHCLYGMYSFCGTLCLRRRLCCNRRFRLQGVLRLHSEKLIEDNPHAQDNDSAQKQAVPGYGREKTVKATEQKSDRITDIPKIRLRPAGYLSANESAQEQIIVCLINKRGCFAKKQEQKKYRQKCNKNKKAF